MSMHVCMLVCIGHWSWASRLSTHGDGQAYTQSAAQEPSVQRRAVDNTRAALVSFASRPDAASCPRSSASRAPRRWLAGGLCTAITTVILLSLAARPPPPSARQVPFVPLLAFGRTFPSLLYTALHTCQPMSFFALLP